MAIAVVVVSGTAAAIATRTDGDDATSLARATTSTTTTSTTAPPTTTTAATTSTAAAPGTCPTLPARRQPDPDRPRYTARVSVDPAMGRVDGDLTVRFTPDLPVEQLVFRLWAEAPRPAAAGARIATGPVTSEGRQLVAERVDATTLEVALGGTARAGRVLEVSLPFTVEVPGSARDRVSRDGSAMRLGSFLPLLAWEPGVGWARQPGTAAFAEAVSSPAADWSVAVTVPDGYQVLATGEPDGGTWRAAAQRDFGMSIGQLRLAEAVVDGGRPVRVTVGVHEGVAEDPAAYLARIGGAISDFARRFGTYPWPTYSLAITPGLEGGIEFPSHVMQGPGSAGRTTSHEVAHQWFYALVGNDQGRDPWIDEGLASYAEARHEGTVEAFRSREIPAAGRGRAGEPMTFWAERTSAYYRSVYVQTAAALASLGDLDLVDCALAHLVAREAYAIATEQDVLDALAAVFGDPRPALAPYGLP